MSESVYRDFWHPVAVAEEVATSPVAVDLSGELHVKGPDAIAIEYRRFMAELGVVV